MTATATPTTTIPTTNTIPTTESRHTPLWRSGALAGVAAAVATTAIAGVALAAQVPVAVEGEQIPLAGFAQLTLMCTAVGILLAKAMARWAAKPRRTFTAVAVALTALSIVPDLTMPATTATRIVLVATHLVAAAIVIPVIARRLPDHTR
jgi:hypothetical protein